jgi:hypothetical protein
MVAAHPTAGPAYLTQTQHAELLNFVEMTHAPPSIASLLIRGPVKSSKSFLMETTLPGMLLARTSGPAPVFLYLNAFGYSPSIFLMWFYHYASYIARHFGVPKDLLNSEPWVKQSFSDRAGALSGIIAQLAEHLQEQGRELVIVIDEIQGPFVRASGKEFQSADERLLIDCLKMLLSSCRTVFTGSGMVTAMLHMSLAKTNGHTFLGVTSCVEMKEPLPNPEALPAMVTAVSRATGCLPKPGGPTVEAVLEAMASRPEFVGGGSNKLPVRLATAAAALYALKHAPANDSLEAVLRDFALSKMIFEAKVDLGRAVQYAVKSDMDGLRLLASLAYGKCTYGDFMAIAPSPFSRIISQLVVPGNTAEEPAQLVPPYDIVVQSILSQDGIPFELSTEEFRLLVPTQLAFFF